MKRLSKVLVVLIIMLSMSGVYARTNISASEQNSVNLLTGWGVLEKQRTGIELNQPLTAINTMSMLIKYGGYLQDSIDDSMNNRILNKLNKFDVLNFKTRTALQDFNYDLSNRIDGLEVKIGKIDKVKSMEIKELQSQNNDLLWLIIGTNILQFLINS